MIRLRPNSISILCIAVLFFPLAAATRSLVSAQSPQDLFSKVQQRYSSIETLSADFQQVFHAHNIEARESGILVMKKPGKMYWEYQVPSKKLFVADGKKTFFYVPAEKQVVVADLDLASADTPLLLLLGKGAVENRYRVEAEAEAEILTPGNLVLKLVPLEPGGEYSEIQVEVDPSSFLIRRLTLVEPIGNRNDYILTNIRENVRVPDRMFEFKTPSGTEVIRQN